MVPSRLTVPPWLRVETVPAALLVRLVVQVRRVRRAVPVEIRVHLAKTPPAKVETVVRAARAALAAPAVTVAAVAVVPVERY
jgi:hypothetical protein